LTEIAEKVARDAGLVPRSGTGSIAGGKSGFGSEKDSDVGGEIDAGSPSIKIRDAESNEGEDRPAVVDASDSAEPEAGGLLSGSLRINQQACEPFAAYGEGVDAIAFSPDGKLLVSAGNGNLSSLATVKLWSLPGGELARVVPDQYPSDFDNVLGAAISPDGTLLATCGFNAIDLFTLPDGDFLRRISINNCRAVAISPNGKTLAAVGLNGWYLYSLPDGDRIAGSTTDFGIYDVAITPDGKLMLFEKQDGIELLSLPDGNLVATLDGTLRTSSRMAVSADGSIVAAVAAGGDIMIWDLDTQSLVLELQTSDTEVHLLAVSADADMLVTCTFGGEVKLWSFPTGESLGTITTAGGVPNAMSLSPDGRLLALGFGWSTDPSGILQLISLPEGTERNCLYDPEFTKRTPMSVGRQQERQESDNLCTCDVVCTCDAVAVPASEQVSNGFVCTCNTVEVGSDTGSSSGSCGGGYWYPN